MPLTTLQFYDILSRHLVPMFSGATVSDTPLSSASEEPVVQENAFELLIRPDPNIDQSFRFRKSYPIEDGDLKIISQFVVALREKLIATSSSFFPFLVEQCPQDVVATSMQPRAADDTLLPSIIALLRKWAS